MNKNPHRRKALAGAVLAGAVVIGYYGWINVGIFIKTSCVSSAPCEGYKDLMGAYYYAEVRNSGYLIGRRAYLAYPGNRVYSADSSFGRVGDILIINMQKPRIFLDGSDGKVDCFDARLEIQDDTLHFTTMNHESVTLKL